MQLSEQEMRRFYEYAPVTAYLMKAGLAYRVPVRECSPHEYALEVDMGPSKRPGMYDVKTLQLSMSYCKDDEHGILNLASAVEDMVLHGAFSNEIRGLVSDSNLMLQNQHQHHPFERNLCFGPYVVVLPCEKYQPTGVLGEHPYLDVKGVTAVIRSYQKLEHEIMFQATSDVIRLIVAFLPQRRNGLLQAIIVPQIRSDGVGVAGVASRKMV